VSAIIRTFRARTRKFEHIVKAGLINTSHRVSPLIRELIGLIGRGNLHKFWGKIQQINISYFLACDFRLRAPVTRCHPHRSPACDLPVPVRGACLRARGLLTTQGPTTSRDTDEAGVAFRLCEQRRRTHTIFIDMIGVFYSSKLTVWS